MCFPLWVACVWFSGVYCALRGFSGGLRFPPFLQGNSIIWGHGRIARVNRGIGAAEIGTNCTINGQLESQSSEWAGEHGPLRFGDGNVFEIIRQDEVVEVDRVDGRVVGAAVDPGLAKVDGLGTLGC